MLTSRQGWLEEDDERAEKIERVVFCQFMEKDERAYEHFIPKYFPPAEEGKTEEAEEKADAAEDGQDTTEAAKVVEAGAEADPGADPEAEKVPDLPEVPTKEPTEPDQPEPKKQKLDDGKD